MDEKYKRMNDKSKIITDGLGTKIDGGIRVLVVLLNYNGIITTQSCWGHKNYGEPFPWIDIEDKCLNEINSMIFDLEIDTENISDTIRIYPRSKNLIDGRIEFNKLKEKLKNSKQK